MSKRILVVEDQKDDRQIIRDGSPAPITKSPRLRTASKRLQRWQKRGPISS